MSVPYSSLTSKRTDALARIRLRNRMNSKYLDDVIEQTGLDFDEAVEMIEREKKAM